jgi:regulator of protease activity HflC (stomatin/prohibitin superfamily)
MIEVPTPVETVLRLSPSEVALVQAALRMLRSVLGREEADELATVQALLERIEAARKP